MVDRPNLHAASRDFRPIMAVGFPAIMANLATPVGSAYTIRVFSDIGEAAIAAGAVIDRVTPVAFGVIFALTGSVGPIIGQNYGAKLMHRVRRTLTNSFILSIGYVLFAWVAAGARRAVARLRLRRHGRQRRLRHFLLPVRRRRLALSRLPLRRQYGLQQPGLSSADDGVQLGPGDARYDSLRDLWRALLWSERRPHRRRARLRSVRPHRGRGGLRDDGAPVETVAGPILVSGPRASARGVRPLYLHCRLGPPI